MYVRTTHAKNCDCITLTTPCTFLSTNEPTVQTTMHDIDNSLLIKTLPKTVMKRVYSFHNPICRPRGFAFVSCRRQSRSNNSLQQGLHVNYLQVVRLIGKKNTTHDKTSRRHSHTALNLPCSRNNLAILPRKPIRALATRASTRCAPAGIAATP